MAIETDYVWDPELSHILFFNISKNISSAAVATFSEHKDSLRVNSLTTDNTPLKYNATFNNRTSNNSLISAYINTQETVNGIRNLTQPDNQTHHTLKAKK